MTDTTIETTETAEAADSPGTREPAFLTVAYIHGHTTVGAVAVTAAVIYFVFWLMGGVMMLGSRHGWPRPYVEPSPDLPIKPHH